MKITGGIEVTRADSEYHYQWYGWGVAGFSLEVLESNEIGIWGRWDKVGDVFKVGPYFMRVADRCDMRGIVYARRAHRHEVGFVLAMWLRLAWFGARNILLVTTKSALRRLGCTFWHEHMNTRIKVWLEGRRVQSAWFVGPYEDNRIGRGYIGTRYVAKDGKIRRRIERGRVRWSV